MGLLLDLIDSNWLPKKFGGKADNDNKWPFKKTE